VQQANAWATPNVPNGGRSAAKAIVRGRTLERADGTKVQLGLEHQVKTWSTPRATDGEKGGPNQAFGAGGVPLPSQAANWPTPNCADHKTSADWPHKGGNPTLVMAASLHSLPAPPNRNGRPFLTPIPFSNPPLDGSISGRLLAEILVYRGWSTRSGGAAGWRGTWTRQPRRQLNPKFVELLMRWPIGWSGFGSLETGLIPWLHGMRGAISTLAIARDASARQGQLL
jgi:hypothetical protein